MPALEAVTSSSVLVVTGLFFCPLQITSLVGITAAMPFPRTALRHWRHRENQNETAKKIVLKETWLAKLRRECFCAQAPNKWQNEEKKSIIFRTWLKKETTDNWVYLLSLWDWTPKEIEKTETEIWTQPTRCTEKNLLLNVQVDFQTFFIKKRRKKEGSKV